MYSDRTLIMVSLLTGAYVLKLGGREFQRWDEEGTLGDFKFGCERWKRKIERFLPVGLTFISLRRYCGSEE